MGIATAQPAAWYGLSTDPLAANIEAIYVGGLGLFNQIDSSAVSTSGTVGSGSTDTPADGTAFSFDSSAFSGNNLTDFGSGPITMACILDTDSSTAGYLMSVGASAGGDNWHTIVYGGNAGVQIFSRGSADGVAESISTRFNRAVISATVAANNSRSIYVNGGDKATNSTTVNVTGANKPTLCGLWRNGLSNLVTGGAHNVPLAVFVRAAWSDADHASFAANPWRVLDDGAGGGSSVVPIFSQHRRRR
jgi:hypothetical protein